MDLNKRVRYLRIALVLFGLILILAIYPAMMMWPSGWRWLPNQSEYELMIVGIYATLGVFLLLAARKPLLNLSLIWFTVWSSFVHGGIMLVQAIMSPHEMGHLIGDVPALFLMGLVLAILTPRKKEILKQDIT